MFASRRTCPARTCCSWIAEIYVKRMSGLRLAGQRSTGAQYYPHRPPAVDFHSPRQLRRGRAPATIACRNFLNSLDFCMHSPISSMNSSGVPQPPSRLRAYHAFSAPRPTFRRTGAFSPECSTVLGYFLHVLPFNLLNPICRLF